MKKVFVSLLLLFLVDQSPAQATDQPEKIFESTVSAAYKGIHLTGFAGHISVVYKRKIGAEVGYGYDFLNSFIFNLSYFITESPNQLFLFAGGGLFQKREVKVYSIRIRTVQAGIGYESEVYPDVLIGQTISVVKYLDERFNIPDLKTKETFDLHENNYFEIGIHCGYRFSLDWLFGG